MAYQLGDGETAERALRRSAREELDRAIAELSDGVKEDPVTAVHDARKALKKERSLLRLARGAMPSRQRRRENAALRDAARGLSGARDAAVLIATLDQLSERFTGQLPASTFDAIRQHLESERGGESDGVAGSTFAAGALHELQTMRLRVDDWEFSGSGWDAIDRGLRRSYRRGRKAFGNARKSRSSEDLHAWRKRVKDLWYQERLLAPSCGPAVRGQAKDAHRVADLLGDDHDLSLLREALTGSSMPVPVDVDAVVELIDHRRTELRTEAIRIGKRIYAEPPKAFRRRMRRSWRAGRGTTTAALEEHPAELAAATRAPHHG